MKIIQKMKSEARYLKTDYVVIRSLRKMANCLFLEDQTVQIIVHASHQCCIIVEPILRSSSTPGPHLSLFHPCDRFQQLLTACSLRARRSLFQLHQERAIAAAKKHCKKSFAAFQRMLQRLMFPLREEFLQLLSNVAKASLLRRLKNVVISCLLKHLANIAIYRLFYNILI